MERRWEFLKTSRMDGAPTNGFEFSMNVMAASSIILHPFIKG